MVFSLYSSGNDSIQWHGVSTITSWQLRWEMPLLSLLFIFLFLKKNPLRYSPQKVQASTFSARDGGEVQRTGIWRTIRAHPTSTRPRLDSEERLSKLDDQPSYTGIGRSLVLVQHLFTPHSPLLKILNPDWLIEIGNYDCVIILQNFEMKRRLHEEHAIVTCYHGPIPRE